MPDYVGLTRALIEPLLEDKSALKVDSEVTAGGRRVLLRLSIGGEERGKVFGRGGRTIKSIRQVLAATAELAQQRLILDAGDSSGGGGGESHPPGESRDREAPMTRRRSSVPRPRPKLKNDYSY